MSEFDAWRGINRSVVVAAQSLVGLHTLSGVSVAETADGFGMPAHIWLQIDELLYRVSKSSWSNVFEITRVDAPTEEHARFAEPISTRVVEIRLDRVGAEGYESVLYCVDETTGLVIVAVGIVLDSRLGFPRFLALWNPNGWTPPWMEDAANGLDRKPKRYEQGGMVREDRDPNYKPW